MKTQRKSTKMGALLATAALILGCCFAQGNQSRALAQETNEPYRQVTETKTHSEYGSSSSEPQCTDTLTQREYDKYGNIIRETTQRVSRQGEAYSDEYQEITDDVVRKNISNFEGDIYTSKVITEYTYDKDHWPLTKSEKRLLPESEWFLWWEKYSEPEVFEYTFKRDEQGRLVQAVLPSAYLSRSPDVKYTVTVEFTYYKSGELKSAKSVEERDQLDSTSGDAATVVQEDVREFRKDGTLSNLTTTIKDKSGSVISRTENTYDDKNNHVSEVITRAQNKGKDLVTKSEYKNKYKNDKLIKQVKWIYGDGVTENREYDANGTCAVTMMPDGSISATRVSSEYDEEAKEFVDVRGETKTYKGPYSTWKFTRAADGTLEKSVEVKYDGTESVTQFDNKLNGVDVVVEVKYDGTESVTEYTNDAHGLTTQMRSYTNTDSGRKNVSESNYQYAQIENPSDFVRALHVLSMYSFSFDFSSSYKMPE